MASRSNYQFGSVVDLNLPDDATAREISCAQLQAYAGLPCTEPEISSPAASHSHWHGEVPFLWLALAITAAFLWTGIVLKRNS